MKKKIIIILTTATVIIGVYTIVVQFDLFGKKSPIRDAIETQVPTQIPIIEEEEAENVKKESTHLTIQQLESVTDARDPFKVAPVVEKEYQMREKEYQELKGKIEKRIAELEEQKARKEAAKGDQPYEPVEKPFEETVKEEIEKIIKASEKGKTTVIDTKKTGKPTTDAKIIELVSKHSKVYKVDEQLVLAIIGNKKASDNKYEIKNPDGTSNRGLMQISTGTAKWLTKLLDMKYTDGMEFDNDTNIKLGTYYLSHLYKQKNDIHYVLTSYYIGPGGAERIKAETGTYESSYSKLILNRMK